MKEIATLTVGYVGNMAKQYVDRGVSFLRSLNIKPFYIDNNDIKFVSESFSNTIRKSILRKNDVVIVRTGIPGTCCVIPDEYDGCNCSDLVIVHPDTSKVNPMYLCAYINIWGQKQIQNNKVGAIQQHFNIRTAEEMLIALPDIQQQNSIARIIENLNDKMFINRKINDNLLQQLQLIYNYWFTQFDFPSKENHPYNASGGDMVRNEQVKRNIPANWEVKSLGELCLFRNGINYDKSIEGEKTYKIINVRNISSTDIMLNENELDEIRLPQKQGDKYCVSAESIIIARSGIPGSTRILYKPSNNTIFCGFVISCTPIDSDMQYYLTFYLKQLESSSATKTGGSILQNVSQDTLSNLIVPIPPKEILGKFNQIVSQTFELFHENLKETSRLVKLRDWLLSLLMNGQATIDD